MQDAETYAFSMLQLAYLHANSQHFDDSFSHEQDVKEVLQGALLRSSGVWRVVGG
jgi:hypothetical protein